MRDFRSAGGVRGPLALATLAVLLASVLAACNRPGAPAAGAASAAAAGAGASAAAAKLPSLLLADNDLLTVSLATVAGGPVITGSLQPEKRADLRAELAAVVLKVLKDNGEPVKAGDVLVQLDDTAIRDNLGSAQEAVRAAELTLEQAERMVQRQKALREQGMTSSAALEDVELRRNAAHSELVAARSREVSARQQLQRTLVRAPFDGVVSERKASPGDTAQVGKELLKVIDPRTMRFEGLVSADRLGEVKVGQAVVFKVNGFSGDGFAGRVLRIDASANASTRQVQVLVGFDRPDAAPRVAGLFAEGRISTGSQQVLVLPDSALVRGADGAAVWRLRDGRVQRVPVKVGERDPRSGDVPLLSGLSDGDRIVRRPTASLVDGQAAEPVAAAGSATAASAAASAARR